MKNSKIVIFITAFILILSLSSCAFFSMEKDPQHYDLATESVYALAKEKGYSGSFEEFLGEFKGNSGDDGISISSVNVDDRGHLIITYTDTTTADAGLVVIVPDYSKITPSIGQNGNWYIGERDTGVNASQGSVGAWFSGEGEPAATLGKSGDFYLSTTTLEIYKKTSSWEVIGDFSKGQAESDSVITKAELNKALFSSVAIRCTEGSAQHSGSGVIYSLDKNTGDAYIITNHHVVYSKNTSLPFKDGEIMVYLYGLEYLRYAIPATYVGGSLYHDIAVLKVTGSNVLKESNAVEAKFAVSEKVSLLDRVIVIGNPLNLGISVTEGYVNVENQLIEDETEYLRVIRVDAALNPGNSGGGVFNADGELIGIAQSKIAEKKTEENETIPVDNLAFALQGDFVKAVVENIIYYADGKTSLNGKILSIGMRPKIVEAGVLLDEETGEIKLYETVAVESVDTGSYAANIGLKKNDVITKIKIGSTEIDVTREYHVYESAIYMRPFMTVEYTVLRDGIPTKLSFQTPSALSFVPIN